MNQPVDLTLIDYHSTCLSNSSLTVLDTQQLINYSCLPESRPVYDILMVQDHHAALLLTLAAASSRELPSAGLLARINAQVLRNSCPEHPCAKNDSNACAGTYRKCMSVSGESYFPGYDKAEQLTQCLLQNICAEMQTELSLQQQLDLAFDAHLKLAAIRPFYKGNGRTARLLMNFILAWFGLPLAIVYSETKATYHRALLEASGKRNPDIFRKFMYGQHARLLKGHSCVYE